MNTKKVFFGVLAVAFLAMAMVSTTTLGEELSNGQTTNVKKLDIGRM